MNDLSPGRIVVMGKNSALSATAIQDAASAEPVDEGMEIYTAYLHARQAGEHLLYAHILRRRGDTIGADHHHTLAMQQLDELTEAIGLELVPQRADALSEPSRAGGLDPLPSSSETGRSHQAAQDAPAAADSGAALPGDAQ